MTNNRLIIGDPGKQLWALQLLAFALLEAASRLSSMRSSDPRRLGVPPLLHAAARALSLPSCAGLNTPLEVLGLAVRNTFELWMRLIHILASDDNYQRWRDEALTDQMKVYQSILTLEAPEHVKDTIRAEIDRVAEHATSAGLKQGVKPMTVSDLARDTRLKVEYDAFYKLYSKLVHPSSWSVNWPDAVSSAMYRDALSANAQVYGWRILDTVDEEFGVSSSACYHAAVTALTAGTGGLVQ